MPVANPDDGSLAILRLGYDERQVRHDIVVIYQRSAYFVAIYLGLSLLVVGLFGRRLVSPLERLRDEAEQIAAGNHTRHPVPAPRSAKCWP